MGWKFQRGFCMHSLHPTPLYRALHLCEVWLVSAAPTRNHHSRAQCLRHQVILTFVSGCNSQSLTTGLLGWIYLLQLGPSLRVVHLLDHPTLSWLVKMMPTTTIMYLRWVDMLAWIFGSKSTKSNISGISRVWWYLRNILHLEWPVSINKKHSDAFGNKVNRVT